jgi:hypothetical protein
LISNASLSTQPTRHSNTRLPSREQGQGRFNQGEAAAEGDSGHPAVLDALPLLRLLEGHPAGAQDLRG